MEQCQGGDWRGNRVRTREVSGDKLNGSSSSALTCSTSALEVVGPGSLPAPLSGVLTCPDDRSLHSSLLNISLSTKQVAYEAYWAYMRNKQPKPANFF